MIAVPPAARVLGDADPQLAIGDELQVLVDGQLETVAGGRRALFAARHRMPPGVRLQEHLAFTSADLASNVDSRPASPALSGPT